MVLIELLPEGFAELVSEPVSVDTGDVADRFVADLRLGGALDVDEPAVDVGTVLVGGRGTGPARRAFYES